MPTGVGPGGGVLMKNNLVIADDAPLRAEVLATLRRPGHEVCETGGGPGSGRKARTWRTTARQAVLSLRICHRKQSNATKPTMCQRAPHPKT